MKMVIKIFVITFILFYACTAFSFGILNPPYNQSDPNFNKLVMRVYNSIAPTSSRRALIPITPCL